MPAVAGVQLGVAATGERYKGRPDLLVAELSTGTSVAGVFTQSTLPAACITWNKANLTTGKAPSRARALVVNAGNANAFTGKQGMDTVKAVAQDTYRLLGGRRRDVFVASTGVIGEPLLPGALTPFLPKAIKAAKPEAWEDAARAIMTTDTFPKGAVATAEIDGQPVTIAGIAKGSGMISPNMATLLGFIFTDASIPSPVLQTLLLIANRESFNAITVDSDTSTNDMVLLFATGQGAQHRPVTRAGDRRLAGFRKALDAVMVDLAKQVVRDGEGASKLIEVVVKGAGTGNNADAIARAIANSPLVKTAIAGEDANWGRLVMAIGKSGIAVDPAALSIAMGGVDIVARGERVTGYDEAAVTQHMQGQSVSIEIDAGQGTGAARVWTCDLTHGYISINADYRS
ncbi:MAG: bifunctional glutamate N-acetyltransferase/amino-acid acetyltransferase ArgJ [Pseudomonadota bacterium]